MSSPENAAVTKLLQEWSGGDRAALDQLIPWYTRNCIAWRAAISCATSGDTLQPTALVNEAYIRLAAERGMQWRSRSHFIAVSAQLMRFILVDHCRKKRYAKRGGGEIRVTFHENLEWAASAARICWRSMTFLQKLEAQTRAKPVSPSCAVRRP